MWKPRILWDFRDVYRCFLKNDPANGCRDIVHHNGMKRIYLKFCKQFKNYENRRRRQDTQRQEDQECDFLKICKESSFIFSSETKCPWNCGALTPSPKETFPKNTWASSHIFKSIND